MLRVFVTATGTPERIELHTSSGSARLDEAALRGVQRWRFVPAHQGGTPVADWILVPIVFILDS
jgi:protein TonB